MKLFKALGTLIVLLILCAAIALTLTTAAVRYMAMNPTYLKTFMTTKSYCAEMRERIADDLDHIALLYGLEEGALKEIVTDEEIKEYTDAMIDALFAEDAETPLKLPSYGGEKFMEYMRQHSAYSEQGIRDFGEDCANAANEDLSAINTPLIIEQFLKLRGNTIVRSSLILVVAGLLLTVLMLIFLKLMYLGKSQKAGGVVIWGGLFMGVSVVFIPVAQFLLFGYIERLNISVSAFRTILTGYLHTVFYGWFIALLALELIVFPVLLVSIAQASHRKKSGNSRKNA